MIEYSELTLIRNILLREIERMVEYDRPTDPELYEWFTKYADLCVDKDYSSYSVRIRLSGGPPGMQIDAQWNMDIGGYNGMRGLAEAVTHVARQNLSLVAQMHWARLNNLFPNSIKDVQLERNMATLDHKLIVKFRNGHEAECLEKEAQDDLFTARCSMLYNLPTI